MNAALIGISGWGDSVLCALKAMEARGELRLAAVSDVQLDRNREKISELQRAGVHYYQDYREMLAKEKAVDVVAIATPIHLHKNMSVEAMEAGFHVLLEKPPASTIQEVDEIISASERTGRLCQVDFLNSSGEAFLEMKRSVEGGLLGEIRTITGVGLWQRLDSYYSRTNWAGRLTLNGNYVLDGTVGNPLSHLLNNMLLLGRAAPNKGSAETASVTAELYHAHDISSEDNSCLRVEMGNGAVLLFYATLCHDGSETPYILAEGTRGTAYWDYAQKLRIETDGSVVERDYSAALEVEGYNSFIANMLRNLWDVASGREGRLYCSAQDTRSFVLALNGAFESSGGTHAIPARFVRRYPEEDSVATHLVGIRETILRAAREKRLFSEMGVEWAVKGREKDMTGYRVFDMQLQ